MTEKCKKNKENFNKILKFCYSFAVFLAIFGPVPMKCYSAVTFFFRKV